MRKRRIGPRILSYLHLYMATTQNSWSKTQKSHLDLHFQPRNFVTSHELWSHWILYILKNIPVVFSLYTQLTSCRYYYIVNKDKTAAIVNLATNVRNSDKTEIFRLHQKRRVETFHRKNVLVFIFCSHCTDKTRNIIILYLQIYNLSDVTSTPV